MTKEMVTYSKYAAILHILCWIFKLNHYLCEQTAIAYT